MPIVFTIGPLIEGQHHRRVGLWRGGSVNAAPTPDPPPPSGTSTLQAPLPLLMFMR